ncbi:MFS transporter [Allofournierella massiliensis]|uniref:MFS transporter n=1 Tax=Allofournierella massiliensis TaxID=1650663 RepID=UPI00356216FD
MKINHQLRALYFLEAVSGFGFAQVIWVVLLAGRGFSLAQIGLAEGFFHLVSLLCEVPSGMAADLLGRRRTLAASMAVRALACLAMIASWGIGGVCLAMGLSALSYNLISGTREAITYDSLLQAGRAGDYERVAGRMGVLYRASAVGCALCAGAALALGWRLAYLTDFAAALAGFVLALGLAEPPHGQAAQGTIREFWPRLRQHVAETGVFLRQNPAAEKMLLDGACGCCAYFGGQLLQPRLMELGLPAGLLGPVLALLPLAGAAGSALAGRMGGRFRFRSVALLCAAGIGGSLALAGAPVLSLALAAGAAAIFWDGVLEVKMTARLNRDFPSDRRATLVSVQSMAYSLAMLPVSPLAGALCDRLGYSGGMAALGLGLLSLVAAGMAAHRCRKGRKRE